jgi:hypothetical protein
MGRALRFSLLVVLVLSSLAAWPQNHPSQPKAGGKVCVATVSNMSASSALVDRMTERLSKSLRDSKIAHRKPALRIWSGQPIELQE